MVLVNNLHPGSSTETVITSPGVESAHLAVLAQPVKM